jgi:hypothetical protein
MSKKNEDSIEKFFRKAVRQYDTSFRESDWRKMEELLDSQAPLPGRGFRNVKRAALAIAGIVILSGSIYFLGFRERNTTEVHDSPLQKMQPAAGTEGSEKGQEKIPTASLHSSVTDSSESGLSTEDKGNSALKSETVNVQKENLTKRNAPETDVRGPAETASPANVKERSRSKVSETASINSPGSETSVVQESGDDPETESSRSGLSNRDDVASASKDETTNVQKENLTKDAAPDADVRYPAETTRPGNEKERNRSNETGVINSPEPKTSVVQASEDNPETASSESGLSNGDGVASASKGKISNVQKENLIKGVTPETDVRYPEETTLPGDVKEHSRSKVNEAAVINSLGPRTSVVRAPADDPENDDGVNPQLSTTKEERPEGMNAEVRDPKIIDPVILNSTAVTDQKVPSQSMDTKPDKEDTLAMETAPEKQIDVLETQEEAEVEEKKNERLSSRWRVVLSLAPDFSSTGFENMSAPGGALGVQIGYRILPRINIHTGLISSSKKYESAGRYYQPPPGYWEYRTNGRVPDQVRGRCDILEIPLWIQYDVSDRDRSRFYVSGGVSSYLMTSESYDYTFETANPGAAEGWSSSESSSYLFAIGHLSAGYERNITPALGLGIEPFVKIPFKGIGWSNVDLFTTGFYVNVRYRFFRKMKNL